MEAYTKWVRRNKDYVHSLESLANGLTWLLPERFSASEIGPEAVTAFFGIVTAINEHIIDTTPTPTQVVHPEVTSFPYALCISALKDLETLVEVVAQHYCGDDKKWNFIAVTEGIKVLVRLALLRDSGYKMLLYGGETPNIEKVASSAQHNIGGFTEPGVCNGRGFFQNYNRQSPWSIEGRALSALSRFGENARMVSGPTWLHKTQNLEATNGPSNVVFGKPTLSAILSQRGLPGGLFVLSEVLFVIRPFIYVLFIRRYGIRSWIPWFLSLAVDLTGMSILSQVTTSRQSSQARKFCLNTLETDEVKRRKLLWALYLMRDPFFSKYTRQRLETTEKILEPVPVVGFLLGKIVELVIGAQTRYTYMSGS